MKSAFIFLADGFEDIEASAPWTSFEEAAFPPAQFPSPTTRK
jgi:putative intracellular protease/amidase